MAVPRIRPYISPLIHLLLWVLLGTTLLLFHPLSWRVELPPEFWIKQGFLFCLLVLVFYLNANLLVPRLLFRDTLWPYILVVAAIPLGLMLLVQMIDLWLNLPELMYRAFRPDGGDPPRISRSHWFNPFLLLVSLLVIGISTSIKSVQKWQKDSQLRLELERQKISSELSFLKAQINPHFFFNTLNNIYALTLTNVEGSRQALHKLSRMMRYVLYETQKDTTLLSQEIAFLQDYIELMQLRLSDKVQVSFEAPKPLKEVSVAPMLLLPFVENAFKHGVSALQPSHIYIGIRQQGPELQIEVRNSIFTKQSVALEESHGIGLANTRRRLDLLYPDRFTLTARECKTENEFRVLLKLHV